MKTLARLAVERPKLVLGAWMAAFGLLALTGLGVESRLHRTDLRIPGSGSDRAAQLVKKTFGDASTLSVLLDGPPRALDAQGPRVAAALDRLPHVTVLSPWAGGEARALRPGPRRVLLVLRVAASYDEVSEKADAQLRRTLDRQVRPPLTAHLTGFADIGRGIERASLRALSRAELIAAPLLMLILLAVFRTPIAAGVPLVLGMTTIGAANGLLSLANDHVLPLDAIALNMASMMGLALGVDYSLLMVSRYREELAAGVTAPRALAATIATAGRTVRFAGLALGIATVAAYLIAPGKVFASASAGILAGVVLSVVAASTGLPAILALLGERVNGRRRLRREPGGRWGALAWRAVRRPALAAGLVLLLLGALALPAMALNSGPPDPRTLPAGSRERQDFEAVRQQLGGGWSAPYEIVVAARRGTVTEPARLAALRRWQAELSRDPRVRSVLGPGAITARLRPLRQAPGRLAQAAVALRDGRRAQTRLAGGLRRVGGGIDEVDAGFTRAGGGAASLAAGADRLAVGAGSALAGTRRLRGGLVRARDELAAGTPRIRRLRAGLARGSRGLTALRTPAQLTERELRDGMAALDAMAPTSKLDPAYRQAYTAMATALAAMTGRDPRSGARVRAGYDGMDRSLAQASTGLAAGAAGVSRLLASTEAARRGFARLAAGATRLQSGIAQLNTGAGALRGGAGRLAGGLDEGRRRARALSAGVVRIEHGVYRFRAQTGRLAGGLGDGRRLAPAMRSGYFALAALDGAPPAQRAGASMAISIDHGGSSARLVVIGTGDPTKGADHLRDRLERDAARLSKQTGMTVAVGGPAAALQDFDHATSSRLPLLVLLLVVVTYLVLVPILRSVVLPALAVLLNVVTVAAAFGVLTLGFQGSAPLGGPGFIDAMMVMGIFSVVFGLSIDYEVFLLARMREGWDLYRDTDAAIRHGLQKTAAVITGAALIMTGVFAAFAAADIVNLRQYGIGLTVAIILDATLVRLVLLPSAIRLLGARAWWMPRWLERRIPEVELDRPLRERPRFVREGVAVA